jgi:hypothetical protein
VIKYEMKKLMTQAWIIKLEVNKELEAKEQIL